MLFFWNMLHPAAAKPSFSRNSPELQAIIGKRDHIVGEAEHQSRSGHVSANALITKLYDNHLSELAEDKRQFDAIEQAEEAVLRRLAAQFPAPVEPEPEKKPAPPRPQQFRPIGETWKRKGSDPLH